MNWDTMLGVVMSGIFFAPLLLALGFFLLVGVMTAFEATVAFAGKMAAEDKLPAAAPEAGPIAARLNEAVEAEANAAGSAEEAAKKEVSNR